MKYLKTYREQYNFCNESIKYFLKPKKEEDVLNIINKLTPKDKLYKGCTYGLLSVVKDAIEKDGVDPSISRNEPLEIACEHGNIDIVKYLLTFDSVDPSTDRNSPIISAAMYGYEDLVKLLLKDERVDPSDKHNRALKKADQNKYNKIVKILLNDDRVINRLKMDDELSFYIREKNYENTNESLNVSKYEWEYSRINNKVGKLYYASKYKLSVANLYELSKLLTNFSDKEVMLMTITAISILTRESKEKVEKLFELLSQYNISQKDIDNLVNKFTTIKNIFKVVASKYDIVINNIYDMLSNTTLLIPFINVLITLIEHQKLNIDILSKPLNDIKNELGDDKYNLMFDRIERKLSIMVSNTSKFKDVKYTEPYRKSHELKPIHMRTKRITL